MLDTDAVVAAYWLQFRLPRGSRAERLRAEAGEGSWAWDAVEDAAREGRRDALDLLAALLTAPEADPGYVGAGPLEELLRHHGARFDEAIAARCGQEAVWRAAAADVWLDPQEAEVLVALRPFLKAVDFDRKDIGGGKGTRRRAKSRR